MHNMLNILQNAPIGIQEAAEWGKTVKSTELQSGLYKKVLELQSLIGEMQTAQKKLMDKFTKEHGMDKDADKVIAALKKEVKEALVEEGTQIVELQSAILQLNQKKVPVSAEKVLEALADQLTNDVKALMQSKIDAMNALTYELKFKENESKFVDFVTYIKQIFQGLMAGGRKFAEDVGKFKAAVAQAANESRIKEAGQSLNEARYTVGLDKAGTPTYFVYDSVTGSITLCKSKEEAEKTALELNNKDTKESFGDSKDESKVNEDEGKTYSNGTTQAEISSYLNDLRDSGATNMFGAGAYVEREFSLPKHEAREAVLYWMEHFEEGKEDAKESKEKKCPACAGEGQDPVTKKTCSRCKGLGKVDESKDMVASIKAVIDRAEALSKVQLDFIRQNSDNLAKMFQPEYIEIIKDTLAMVVEKPKANEAEYDKRPRVDMSVPCPKCGKYASHRISHKTGTENTFCKYCGYDSEVEEPKANEGALDNHDGTRDEKDLVLAKARLKSLEGTHGFEGEKEKFKRQIEDLEKKVKKPNAEVS